MVERKKFEIIPLLGRHLAQVASIEKESFISPWSETAFRQECKLPSSVAFVATERESDSGLAKVIGYAFARVAADEMEILNLAVGISWRRRGVATALLQKVIESARDSKVKKVFLDVRSSNVPARKLYDKLNFEVCAVRRRYYTDTGEDALLMKKTVD